MTSAEFSAALARHRRVALPDGRVAARSLACRPVFRLDSLAGLHAVAAHGRFILQGPAVRLALERGLEVDLVIDRFTGLGTWVANEGACEKICMPLDGKVMSAFLDPEEVAHPNCQCAIEPIEAEPPAGALERSVV